MCIRDSNNVDFYRKKMKDLGVEPGDIKGIEDINKLPFTTKEDLRDNYPFGLLAIPKKDVVRVQGTSGTTGKDVYKRQDMGSPLTNKYAEGYPGKRYYGGCQCVDVVENLARERAKELFQCEYANVQPHSGAQANMAAMFAMV